MENGDKDFYLKLMLSIIDCEHEIGNSHNFFTFLFLIFLSELKEMLQGFVLLLLKSRLISKYFSEHY